MSGTTGTGRPATRTPFTLAVGVAAVAFSALYSASDVLELVQGCAGHVRATRRVVGRR
jgi:hypothetical protein